MYRLQLALVFLAVTGAVFRPLVGLEKADRRIRRTIPRDRRAPLSKHVPVSREPRRQAQGCQGVRRQFRPRSLQFGKPSCFVHSRHDREGNGGL